MVMVGFFIYGSGWVFMLMVVAVFFCLIVVVGFLLMVMAKFFVCCDG